MDDALNAKVEQLNDDCISASEEVSVAIEGGEDQRQLKIGKVIEQLAKRYAELLDELDEGADREKVERKVGRRMTDLRRQAQQLTRRASGQPAQRATDAGLPFILSRTPSKSIVPSRNAPSSRGPKYSVGGEVDAWCGKCADVKTHHVVAMVGDEPKQVICQTCRSRHGYRTSAIVRGGAAAAAAAAESKAAASTTPSAPRSLTAEEREAQRKQDIKRVLIKELDEAAEPRSFDPRGRYKPGEIIVHPEHGRGKIENVLRGSMLVRFREGLRPVNLK